MKLFSSLIFLLALSVPCIGQVMFRNDIVLGKHVKSRNKGISFISVSMGRSQGMVPMGSRTNTLTIDVQALRNPKQTYTYQQLAERVYGVIPGLTIPDPHFPKYLLLEPPRISLKTIPTVHVRPLHD